MLFRSARKCQTDEKTFFYFPLKALKASISFSIHTLRLTLNKQSQLFVLKGSQRKNRQVVAGNTAAFGQKVIFPRATVALGPAPLRPSPLRPSPPAANREKRAAPAEETACQSLPARACLPETACRALPQPASRSTSGMYCWARRWHRSEGKLGSAQAALLSSPVSL